MAAYLADFMVQATLDRLRIAQQAQAAGADQAARQPGQAKFRAAIFCCSAMRPGDGIGIEQAGSRGVVLPFERQAAMAAE